MTNLLISGMGSPQLLTEGLGGILVPPTPPTPEISPGGLSQESVIKETIQKLEFVIIHESPPINGLPLVIHHIKTKPKELPLLVLKPIEQSLPIVVKHLNVLIEGFTKSIRSSLSKIDISSDSSVTDVKDESTKVDIE